MGESAWRKSTTLYPSKSAMNSKLKTVAFHYDKDILCQIAYDDGEKVSEGLGVSFLL